MNCLKLFLIGFKKGFMKFGIKVSNIINFVLLFVVYFIGVGLTAVFAKATGKKFVDKTLGKTTYWVAKQQKDQKKTIARMY